MIEFTSTGSWAKTESSLKKMSDLQIANILRRYGNQGVNALRSATPVESGLTAESWNFEVESSRGRYSISWTNTNVVSGVPVAVLLQYGHGTGTGGYVQGYDYINPAMRGLFDSIADAVWKEVKSA